LFKPLIDGASVNSVRPTIAMSFDPIDGSYQTFAILVDGAVTLGIEETFGGRQCCGRFAKAIAAKSSG
jgi:hypothetical protein